MKRMTARVGIVGAGPTGLVLALLLARAGIETVVVERRDGPHRAPQAHVVTARTMEIMRALGLHERIRAEAVPMERIRNIVWCATLAGAEFGRLSAADFLTTDAGPTVSTAFANVAQNRLEPILHAALATAPFARVAFGTAMTGFEDGADGVRVMLRHADGGTGTLEVDYLVGADGAGSTTRRLLDIAFDGPALINRFLGVHFEADLSRYTAHRPGPLYWSLGGGTAGVFIGYDIDRTWVFMAPFYANADKLEDFTEERCLRLIRGAIGDPDIEIAIRHIDSWVMSAQVAERYRDGRVFLAGDAAHRFPPTGGLGMNTGIADAFNLGWKLAAVSRGAANATLLDSYEAERRPVALVNCAQSLHNHVKMDDVWRAFGIEPRNLDRLSGLLEGGFGRRLPRALVRGIMAVLTRGALRHVTRLRPGDPTLDALRPTVAAAIREQADHFVCPGLDLGYVYDLGAVAGPAATASPVATYHPQAAAGARLPCTATRDGRRLHDAIDPARLTLYAPLPAGDWQTAAAYLEQAGWPIVAATAAPSDPARYCADLGLAAGDALLIRPDGHIAAHLPARDASAAALRDMLAALHMQPSVSFDRRAPACYEETR